MSRQWEKKRKHTPEFKVQAVRLMRERLASGVTLQRVSEELDVGADQLRVWGRQVAEAPDDATAEQIFPGYGHKRTIEKRRVAAAPVRPLSLEDELKRLTRENERLRQERDFLKKAAAFFAKESR